MAVFDAKAAGAILGDGGGALNAVGTGFGVPSCMLGLASKALSLLPSPVLFQMQTELNNGIAMADGVIKSIFSQVRNIFGIIEWDSEEGGFKFISNSSKLGFDLNSGIGTLLAYMQAITALGAGLYAIAQDIQNEIDQITRCIGAFKDYLRFRDGNSADEISKLDPVSFENYINDNYALERRKVEACNNFIASAQATLDNINEILIGRADGILDEPLFSCSAIDYLSGTSLLTNCEVPPVEDEEIFRLIYGPPKSSFGQFILSNDGIYFDSQTSGITPALQYLINKRERTSNFFANKWKFSFAPNQGGKGDQFSTDQLKEYFNTLYDFNVINDSESLKPYYDNDKFLQELIGNKNKRIYDLSAQISELELEGAADSIIYNQRQALVSENSNLQQQINKRKKQIELAVVLPSFYETGIRYSPGKVPLNDFSYLKGTNISLDIQKQKALSFSQADIDTVVKPLQLSSNYVTPRIFARNSSLEHLIVPELGEAAIIYDGSSVYAVDAPILAAESFVTTDSAIAVYNFLDTDIQSPSSIEYLHRNSIAEKGEEYAQLVSTDQAFVFRPGLGVPYFQGITIQNAASPKISSSVGSYLKLPNTKKFQDLLYNKTGASIDFWVHTPDLLSIDNGYNQGDVSSLYRLVLANENTGYTGKLSNDLTEAPFNEFGNNTVRGFMMGFTRDRRLCSELPASNIEEDNLPNESVFFLAPTQSTSPSTVGLINRSSFDGDDCRETSRYHSMTCKVATTQLSSCEGQFCHIAITFNPTVDEINLYLDGNLLATSSISYVFGIDPYRMPNLPTFKKTNSFEYLPANLDSNAAEELKYGPRLNTYFTPWIVGGGYTDGIKDKNFMGTDFGGIISGLRGYLGSLKFYSKPLSSEEILNNYTAHKTFFKNIDTLSLG